jgi:hypothetical protein
MLREFSIDTNHQRDFVGDEGRFRHAEGTCGPRQRSVQVQVLGDRGASS